MAKTEGTGPKNSGNTGSPRIMDGAEYRRVHRSQLKGAPYNPRQIDEYAAQGLRDSIRKTGGLIETPVWNKRTGNLVGGHQRLAQTDKLAEGQDYEVTVAVIDVDEKTERELNVRLNNPTIQGRYDVDGLEAILQGGANYREMGFDIPALEMLFLESGRELDPAILAGGFDDGMTKIADGLGLGTGVGGDEKKQDPAHETADRIADTLIEADVAKQREKEDAKIRAIKDRKQEYLGEVRFKTETAVAVTIVFPTAELLTEFLEATEQEPGTEKIDGIQFCRFMALDTPKAAKAGGWEDELAEIRRLNAENEGDPDDPDDPDDFEAPEDSDESPELDEQV